MYRIPQSELIVLKLEKGILEAARESRDFEELEEKVQRLIQEATRIMLGNLLTTIDDEMLADKEKEELKVVGNRTRGIITTVGEIKIKRRLYEDKETNKYHFMLDEALGIEKGKRVSKRMEKLMLELGTEMSFRRAAKILQYLVPGISHQKIWEEVQKAGEKASREVEEKREAIFEDGEVPVGRKKIGRLCIEADGIFIPQQRSEKKVGELKIATAYEGKENGKLKNKRTVVGLTDGETLWEQACAEFSWEWDLTGEISIDIGGDGAEWIKEGAKIFPGARYHLDAFHLRKKITEALGFKQEYCQAVYKKIQELDREGLQRTFDQILKPNQGKKKKKIEDLRSYILKNWEGIVQVPKEERLGAIEGQGRHIITRRMKHIGARWSPLGTEHMGRLLAAKANNELHRYAGSELSFKRETLSRALAKVETASKRKAHHQSEGAWLRASVPALAGPNQDKIWVKKVLKPLTLPVSCGA